MSEDLEKRAAWYRKTFGDEDIADILEVAARMSRRRNRPERFEEQSETPVEPTRQRETPKVDFETYFSIQRELLDIFSLLAPKRERRYSAEEQDKILKAFNRHYGKHLPDDLLMLYLVTINKTDFSIGDVDVLKAKDHAHILLQKIDTVDVHFRSTWNNTMNTLARNPYWKGSFRREKPPTLGEYRQMSDLELYRVKDVGQAKIRVFRTALSKQDRP